MRESVPMQFLSQIKARHSRTRKNKFSKMTNDIGDKIVVKLPGGLFLVMVWIDSKLDPETLQIFVDKSGRKVLKRSCKPSAQTTAQELLQLFDSYTWAKNNRHVMVSLLQEELNQIQSRRSEMQNDWEEEVLCYLDEEVIRSTVDVDGNHTNQIEATVDEYGRQFISFFLKTAQAPAMSAPASFRGKHQRKGNGLNGMDIDCNKHSAVDSFDEETIEDIPVQNAKNVEIDQLKAQMNGMGSLLQQLVVEMQRMQHHQQHESPQQYQNGVPDHAGSG